LEREDLFTVVHDQVLTDTARYADVVLPATTHFEVDDVAHSYGTYTLQAVERAVDPVGESRSNDQLAAAMAARLGLPTEHFDPDPGRLFAAVVTDGEGPGPRVLPGPGVQFADVFPSGGRAVLWDPVLADPVPRYRELASPYPLTLLTPASSRTINSMFGEQDQTVPPVLLNPVDAAARGLADGQSVELHNDLGRVGAVVQLDATVRPGVAVMAKGAWLRRFPNGSGANALVPADLEHLAGGACFNDARIEVTALGR
jgi:anaerobic selenocysteine-containing dehydrogenase